MLIRDLCHFDLMNQSSHVFGGQQANDGLLILELDENNAISLKQGDKLLFQQTLTDKPTGLRLSIAGIPNLAVSSRTLTVNNQSTALLTVDFNSGSPLSLGLI